MRKPLALLAALLAALSGCMSGAGDDDQSAIPSDTTDADGDGVADPKVVDGSGTIMAGAGTPVLSFNNGGGSADFAVSANVTLLYAELSWSSPIVALDLCVHAPSDGANEAGVPICGEVVDGGGPGTPTGLVTYTLASPEVGDGWTINPYLDGPAAQQDFQLKVTLFYGETEVPAGYTALA